MGASGISTSFLELSRTSGQVPHVLLTRSPLGRPQCCHWLDPARLACIRHAASVRPEPGSNSPSRSLRRATEVVRRSIVESRCRRGFLVDRLAPEQTSDVVVRRSAFELMVVHHQPELGANARTRFFVLYSVFKEHPRAREGPAAGNGRGRGRWSVRRATVRTGWAGLRLGRVVNLHSAVGGVKPPAGPVQALPRGAESHRSRARTGCQLPSRAIGHILSRRRRRPGGGGACPCATAGSARATGRRRPPPRRRPPGRR